MEVKVKKYYNLLVPKIRKKKLRVGLREEEYQYDIDVVDWMNFSPKVRYKQADFEKLRGRNKYDEIECFGALESLPASSFFLVAGALLKPGGKIKCTIQADNWWVRFYNKYLRREHPKDPFFTQKKYRLMEIRDMVINHYLKLDVCELREYGSIYYIEAHKPNSFNRC